jgi:hypothetical protein
MKRVTLPYTDIEVSLPPVAFFIERLERDEPFHFLRANHGILDLFIEAFSYRGKVQAKKLSALVDQKMYEVMVKKIAAKHHRKKKSVTAHGKALSFEEKLQSFMNVFFNHDTVSEKLLIGVSVDVGLDTVWGRMPEMIDDRPTNLQLNREILLSMFFSRDDSYYHSGILKHYAVMGELQTFFNFLKREDYTLVFLGPDYFRHFEKKLNLKNFVHISTPHKGAIDFYDSYIEEIRDLASRKKIFLFHASGHVASAYLAEKLKDEKFSAFDIGMSFDWLLKDILDEEPTACERSSCWSRNCDSKELKNYIKQLRK